MGLNKVKDNMYEWVTKRVNPLAGECLHNCSYCYVKGLKKRFPKLNSKYSGELRLVEYEFKKKFKKDDVVFVCTCNDLFADNVPSEYINKIIDFYNQFESTILYQTKNPGKIHHFTLPEKSIICTTIETNRWYPKYMGNTLNPQYRAIYMDLLGGIDKYVTCEPLMDFDLKEMVNLIKLCNPIQVNIGSDSGHNNLPEPSKEKVFELVSELEKFTKVKLKKNLNRLIK